MTYHYPLPLADITEPLSVAEIDAMPEAARIYATIKAAIGDREFTQDDVGEACNEAEAEGKHDGRLEAIEEIQTAIERAYFDPVEDEDGNMTVESNLKDYYLDADLTDAIVDAFQAFLDRIEFEDA